MAREVEFRRSAAVAVIGHGFAVHAHFVIGRSPSQMEEYLPVGPCERHGELGRENVAFLRPVRQTGEVTGVARKGCGRFLRRGVTRGRRSEYTPAPPACSTRRVL